MKQQAMASAYVHLSKLTLSLTTHIRDRLSENPQCLLTNFDILLEL